MNGIYLDHAATTPLDPRVLEAMLPHLRESYGNASSVHTLGRKARFAVEQAREQVAALLGAAPGEIVFTSGGTEANNTVLKGSHGPLVTCAAEHESVLRAAESMEAAGRPVAVLAPDESGVVPPAVIEARMDAFDDEAGLVSIMHANNEIGTISPIDEVVSLCRSRGWAVHCDGVQSAGYGMIRPDGVDLDAMTISGHKFYGPKGIGVLFVRGGADVRPLLEGGAQERGRRGGTENVPAIVGFAKALCLALDEADDRREHAVRMRDRLIAGIRSLSGAAVRINTPVDSAEVAPHIVNVAFPPIDGEPVDGEMLLLNLDMEGIFASAGSACTSGAVEPSHVLRAIGLPRDTAAAAVRFSVGKGTTEEDVDRTIEALERVIRRVRPARVAP